MTRLRILGIALLGCAAPTPVFAQALKEPPPVPAPAVIPAPAPGAEAPLLPVPFGFDFLPHVGTSSALKGRDLRFVSFNLIGGYAGALRGFELAGMVNIERRFASGLQIAGVSNVVLGPVDAVQIAGVGNVASGDVRGLQIGGVFNLAERVQGVQIGGVFNLAARVRGVQIGVINVARKTDLAIGVVNINREGRTHLDVWGSDTGILSAGVKHGGDYYHWIYGVGVRPSRARTDLAGIIGLGGHAPIGSRLFLDVDALLQMLVGPKLDKKSLGSLVTFRAVLGVHAVPKVAFYVGPTLNLYWSDNDSGARLPLFGDRLVRDGGGSGRSVRVWPGFVLGAQFL